MFKTPNWRRPIGQYIGSLTFLTPSVLTGYSRLRSFAASRYARPGPSNSNVLLMGSNGSNDAQGIRCVSGKITKNVNSQRILH